MTDDRSSEKDIDLSTLYEIADGSDEFIVESIGMFLDQTPELLQDVQNAITAKDWVVTAAAAHKIKSNLGFFGMFNSQALIQEVELLGKSGSPDVAVIIEKFNQVKGIMADNLVALAQIKAETEAKI